MILNIIFFILGLGLLIKGAEIMINGSSSLARRFNISPFVIGLTIVAFGTSAPELFITAMASLKGNAGLALGNIIGSNIANTLLILGIAAVITPLVVKRATINKEIPFSLLAILAVGFLVNDFLIDNNPPDGLTRIDGLILILFFIIFLYYTFGITKSKENIFQKTVGEIKKEEPKEYGWFVSGGLIVIGLISLTLGGYWLIDSAIFFSRIFNISQALIGLTVVAIGSSLPELVASAVAAKRGHTDMAVGNVIGSNIFNLLLVLGLSSVIGPISYNPALNIDMVFLFGVTILLLFLIYIGRKNIIDKREGLILLGLYGFYLLFLVLKR